MGRLGSIVGSRHRGLPRAGDKHGLLLTEPGRHGDGHRGHRFGGRCPELKLRAQWNGQTHPGFKRDELFALSLLAPHFAATSNNEPQFLHRAMGDGPCYYPSSQMEMRHAAAAQGQQHANIGPVWRVNRWFSGEWEVCEFRHGGSALSPNLYFARAL